MVLTRSQRIKERRESFSLKDLMSFSGREYRSGVQEKVSRNQKKITKRESKALSSPETCENKENTPDFVSCNESRKELRAKFLKSRLSKTYCHLELHSEKSVRVRSRLPLSTLPCNISSNETGKVKESVFKENLRLKEENKKYQNRISELEGLLIESENEKYSLQKDIGELIMR